MRSKWSAETVLLWLATATLEGAWLTLTNVLLQWLKKEPHLDLGILAFSLAVGVGMALAHTFRDLPQRHFASIITAATVCAFAIGALMSGDAQDNVGTFLRNAVLDPGAWLMGLAVLRGSAQGQPGAGYSTERVFSLGIPALVVFWLLATATDLVQDQEFVTAGFTATLSFISAGLLALGLGRLSDLDVESVDTAARRRWLLLVVGIVGSVLLIGLPLAAILGVPAAAAAVGILGPLAPLIIALFTLMSIPVFWLFDLLVGVLNPAGRPIASVAPEPTPIGSGPPPLFEPPSGAPPDLTWLLIALVVVGIVVLLRILYVFLDRPAVSDRAGDAPETRAAEPISMPHLPHIALPRFGLRRPTARTAADAYRMALVALAGGPNARLVGETPREHALRISASDVGPDVGRLATDYQLEQLAGVRLTCQGNAACAPTLEEDREADQAQSLTRATMRGVYQPAHGKFVVDDPAELLRRLCASLPATLVTTSLDGELRASILPMLFDPDAGDRGTLRGHLARPNHQWRDARPGAEAIAIFNGPDAYVTPTWYEEKRRTGRVVPTWNYSTVVVHGVLVAHDDPDWVVAHVRSLVDAHEGQRPEPWSVDDAPESYIHGQAKGIVGLELLIGRIDAEAQAAPEPLHRRYSRNDRGSVRRRRPRACRRVRYARGKLARLTRMSRGAHTIALRTAEATPLTQMTDALNPPIDAMPDVATDSKGLTSDAEAAAEEAAVNVRYRSASLPSAPFWLILIAAVVFVSIIAATWSVVFMFAVGLALFALMLPIVNWLSRRGVPRGLASLIVVALMVVAAILVGWFALAVYFNSFLPFLGSIPERLTRLQANSPAWLAGAIQGILDSINSSVANVDTATVALGFLKGVFGLVGTALALTMLPFFVFYLLTDQPRMSRAMHNDIPVPWRPYVKASVNIFVNDFANYFKAEVVVGVIQGVMVTIGVFIIGLIVGPPLSDYVLLLGLIAGVMELLPQIGPIIALIPAMLLALATSPLAVVLVGIFYLVVFIIEANVLVPKIEGEVVSFSAATVIFLVAVGIALGGIIGGNPCASCCRDRP